MANEKKGASNPVAKRVLIGLAAAIALLVVAFFAYVSFYYHGDQTALAAAADADGARDGVTVQTLADGSVAFMADDPIAGMVFYPGAKVEPESYAPLLTSCAQKGVTCVLVKPPFNLAIFDKGAAGRVIEQLPDLDTWAVAGHSLGGSMGGDYVAEHADDVEMVVFLASYPNEDLSSYDGAALSIIGTEDTVINRPNYEHAKSKLPKDARELVIDGGNHAGFGNYGEQDGDGPATIAPDQQQEQAASAIASALSQRALNP